MAKLARRHKPMHPDIKAAWVAALRSGRYPQGMGGLRTRSGFCCLGVLCDLYSPTLWQPGPRSAVAVYAATATDWNHLQLPQTVRQWAQLPNGVMGDLATKNDSGVSFAALADWIEAAL